MHVCIRVYIYTFNSRAFVWFSVFSSLQVPICVSRSICIFWCLAWISSLSFCWRSNAIWNKSKELLFVSYSICVVLITSSSYSRPITPVIMWVALQSDCSSKLYLYRQHSNHQNWTIFSVQDAKLITTNFLWHDKLEDATQQWW